MKRSYKLFVEDILDAMEKIERYIKSLSYDEFTQNEIVIDAVIRNLEVIGEASTNIPEDALAVNIYLTHNTHAPTENSGT